VEGHPEGEGLLNYLEERAVAIEYRRLQQTRTSPPGRGFWFSTTRPEPGGPLFYFTFEPWAFIVPRIAMGRDFLGLIAAHELRHARDQERWQELMDLNSFHHVIMEQTAYQLTVDLADHCTDGTFSRLVNEGLAHREYKKENRLVLVPKRSLTFRFDALFGPPSPWEISLRTPCYILSLTYATCSSQLERIYATWAFLNWAGYRLDPPGFEWFTEVNHQGIDLRRAADETITSPLFARVERLIEDIAGGTSWQGLVLSGIGSDMSATVRILGIEPTVSPGQTVNIGDQIGRVQKAERIFKNIDPHLHVELYRHGTRENADATLAFLEKRWDDRRPITHGLYLYFQSHRGLKMLRKAFRHEADRKYDQAAALFERARTEPWWDISPVPIDHYLARAHAAAGDFQAAAAVQEEFIDELVLLLAYSRGSPPGTELGTIGTCAPEILLATRLNHQRENLEAYRRGEDTIWVY